MSSPSSTRSSSPARAFTLIELLTVIAIIGILASIIIPVVGKVRESARNTQCVSVLRDWGRLIQLFANDNRGRYAHNWASTASSPYLPYLNNSASAFKRYRVCPTMPADILETGTPTFALVRGAINGTASPQSGDYVDLARSRNPSQYLLMVDAVYKNGGYTNAGASLTRATSGNNSVENLIAPLFSSNPSDETSKRHGSRGINGVFGDGSTRRITGTTAGSGDNSSIFEMRNVWLQLN